MEAYYTILFLYIKISIIKGLKINKPKCILTLFSLYPSYKTEGKQRNYSYLHVMDEDN